jgi:hypothetical protein
VLALFAVVPGMIATRRQLRPTRRRDAPTGERTDTAAVPGGPARPSLLVQLLRSVLRFLRAALLAAVYLLAMSSALSLLGIKSGIELIHPPAWHLPSDAASDSIEPSECVAVSGFVGDGGACLVRIAQFLPAQFGYPNLSVRFLMWPRVWSLAPPDGWCGPPPLTMWIGGWVPCSIALVWLLVIAVVRFRRWRRRRLADGPLCDACGYNLTGNVTGRCPECGAVIAPADATWES